MSLWLFMSFVALLILVSMYIHYLAEKHKFSFPLFMLILASIFAFLTKSFLDTTLMNFSMIDTLLWVCIVIVSLDVASRLHWRMWDHFTTEVFKFVIFETLLMTVVLSLVFYFLFFSHQLSWAAFLVCAFFSWLWVGTTPSHISFSHFDAERHHPNLHEKFMELSSYLGEMATILLIFFFLPFFIFLPGQPVVKYTIHPFITWVVFGVGTGLLGAMAIVRLLRGDFSATFHSLLLIVSAWLVYAFASFIKGNGIIAVLAFGLAIGIFSLKNREEILAHSSNLRVVIEILAFFFAAWLISIPTSWSLYAIAILCYIVYVILRNTALYFSFGEELPMRERMYLALYTPKGVVFALCLSTLFMIAQRIPPPLVFPFKEQLTQLCQVSLIFLFITYLVAFYLAPKRHHYLRSV